MGLKCWDHVVKLVQTFSIFEADSTGSSHHLGSTTHLLPSAWISQVYTFSVPLITPTFLKVSPSLGRVERASFPGTLSGCCPSANEA